MAANGSNSFGIRDNYSRGKVADFIKEKVTAGCKLSVVSAYFTIYAYEALSTELDRVDQLHFLFGEPRFIASLYPNKADKKTFKIEDESLELANRLQQKEIARRCAATIEALRVKANELLQQFFHDVEVRLTVRGKLELTGVGRGKSLIYPKVFVAATFCGQQTRLYLHHFLNEARLSALAISLYLASLLIVPAAKLCLLVLDDLLIGIDMSNRMTVLNILREQLKEWQIILLTHDRVWYETVRMSTLYEKTWWYAALYAETSLDLVPTPLWRGHEEGWTDNLIRARQHFADHDDRAAGVYARAAFEGKLKCYCNNKGVSVQYKTDPAKMTTEMFRTAIKVKLTTEGKLAGVQNQVSDIETYRKIVLNPLSHEHPTTLTSAEIQGAITAIAELDKVLK